MGVKVPYRREMAFEYGTAERLSPRIRRVIAHNPSPFTFHGTGTYIIGEGQVAVIDPGPDLPEHVEALRTALAGETITHILVTHCHLDHSPACRALREFTDAPTYAYGPHGAGRSAPDSSGEVEVKVEEGADLAFRPDHEVRHGDVLEGDGWSVECLHTPGHTSNHSCFQLREERTLFTGDHVMAWSTSVISPPDGDMHAYMASLELLLERDDLRYWPTHGPSVEDPKAHVRAFIAHRREREAQILACVGDGVHSITAMVPRIYAGHPEFMYPAAARSVYAAVIYLIERGALRASTPLSMDSHLELA
ncbi:MAG: MBL fold metallo-hydrolase [Pseudomonadales bacterium]|jgi:glyoxylase-like metal-dependent hydrolase (beta-lactamase superfamily II)|nr:MBL fold metallo-hydrolase [Pseudomonadales bacterium]